MTHPPLTEPTRVLIVHSQVARLNSIAELLESKGFKTETADSIQQALQVAKKFEPHLIVLDLWFPYSTSGSELPSDSELTRLLPCGLGGLWLIRTLKREFPSMKFVIWEFFPKATIARKMSEAEINPDEFSTCFYLHPCHPLDTEFIKKVLEG